MVLFAVEAQQKLEQVQQDLEEVSLREKQLKETSRALARELDKQRNNETTSASDLVDMRGQLSAMQTALQSKEQTLSEMREELKKGSQVRTGRCRGWVR
jgi:septal ring factor EnvC (AmiA/AmiB activator)